MDQNFNEQAFADIPYGSYTIKDDGSFMENVRYGNAESMKLNIRKIRLPDGKGNIVEISTRNSTWKEKHKENNHKRVARNGRLVYISSI